jgi:hypothetical protein
MSFQVYRAGDFLVGADRGCGGFDVRRLLHHQKIPAPSKAISTTPTIVNLIAQRMASLAIKKNIASKTTPAIRKMVVKLIGNQCAVGSRWPIVRGKIVNSI